MNCEEIVECQGHHQNPRPFDAARLSGEKAQLTLPRKDILLRPRLLEVMIIQCNQEGSRHPEAVGNSAAIDNKGSA